MNNAQHLILVLVDESFVVQLAISYSRKAVIPSRKENLRKIVYHLNFFLVVKTLEGFCHLILLALSDDLLQLIQWYEFFPRTLHWVSAHTREMLP